MLTNRKKIAAFVLVLALLACLLSGCVSEPITSNPVSQPPASSALTAPLDVWRTVEYNIELKIQQSSKTEVSTTSYCYTDNTLYFSVVYLEPMAQFACMTEIHRYNLLTQTDEIIYTKSGEGMWGNEVCTNGKQVAFSEKEAETFSLRVYDIASESWCIAKENLKDMPLLAINDTHLIWYGRNDTQALLCSYRLSDGLYQEQVLSDTPYAYGRVAVYQEQVVYQADADLLIVLNMQSGEKKEYRLGQQAKVFDLDYDGAHILWSTQEQPRAFYTINCTDQSVLEIEVPKEYKNESFFKAYYVAAPWVSINTNRKIFLWNGEEKTFTLFYQADRIYQAQRFGNKIFLNRNESNGKITFLCIELK